MAHPAFDVILAAAFADDDLPGSTGREGRLGPRGANTPSTLSSAQPPLTVAEETVLLQRLRGENETNARSAFSALYDAHVHALWRFATRLTGSASDAEEMVHDVFTRVWTHRASWEPAGSVAAYLFRAVRNQAIDLQRHADVAGRIGTQSINTPLDMTLSIPGHSEAPTAPDAGPLSLELRNAVRNAIALLPERRRTALALRYVHAMSYAQIATVLGVTEKAAFILVSRTRDALKPVLQKFLDRE